MKREHLKSEIEEYLKDICSSKVELIRLLNLTDDSEIDVMKLNYIKNSVREIYETLEDIILDIREDIHWGK